MATTTTTLVTSPNPSIQGSPVTLTATVSPVPAGGTVDFVISSDGPVLTVPVTLGVASTTISTLSVGPHTVVAAYSGTTLGGGFDSSVATGVQLVTPASSSTTLTANPASSVCGQPVTFTANVDAPPPGTGTVTFVVDGVAQPPVNLVPGAPSPRWIWGRPPPSRCWRAPPSPAPASRPSPGTWVSARAPQSPASRQEW